MSRQPEIYSAAAIRAWDTDREIAPGKWVPARPYGHNLHTFLWRWHLAWLVLIGQCDALAWQDKQT